MIYLRGIAWLGDWSKVRSSINGGIKPAFFCFVFAEGLVRFRAMRARLGRRFRASNAQEMQLRSKLPTTNYQLP